MIPFRYRKAPALLAFGSATLAPDMADREIGMDPREGTRRSPPGQRDRFPSEAQGVSPVPLVTASLTPIEARGDAVSLSSPVPLVPEKATEQDLQYLLFLHQRSLGSRG
ncbi:hypothetical protein KY285_023987 [Solanum tuberosum]|nr:hypothetical protein KY285_023987 [Solanum tuberosum]